MPRNPPPEISFADAIKAIEARYQAQAFWIAEAMTLLMLAAQHGKNDQIDFAKLAERCRKHAETVP